MNKVKNNMGKFLHNRLLYLLVLIGLALAGTSSSLSAQEEVTETPAPEATEVVEAPAVETTTEPPTTELESTPEVIPTEPPPIELTLEATPEVTATVESMVESTPEITETAAPPATTPTGGLSPEPALTLRVRELFETEPLTQWSLPAGWSRVAVNEGFALRINAAEAGNSSAASLNDSSYGDVAVMGYFTFEQGNGAVQLVVRDSAAGAYAAQLDASGAVILLRRGNVIATATTTVSGGMPHVLQLSVIGGSLRVAVDETELIAFADIAPLPPGQVKVGVLFPSPESGSLLFDNFFLWTPGAEVEAETATPVPPTVQPTEDTLNSDTVSAAFGPPPLTAPALNGVVSTLRPTFSWGAVTGANLYHLRVATNFSCTTPVSGSFDIQLTARSQKFTTDLPQGEYWFCVEARDAGNNWSGFGEKRRFVVNVSLTPANNRLVVVSAPATTANVKFTWTAVPGATYAITVATDSSFTVFAVDNVPVATNTYTMAGQSFGTYYWRVTVNGMHLPSSLARSITITPPVPSAPAIQKTGALTGAVTDKGFTNDTTPIMDWTVPTNWASPPSGQSITYELALATDRNFTALVAAPITGLASANYEWTATTLADTSGQLYYWRVRAVTNLGVIGAWSKPYSFTLDTTRPEPPNALTAPLDDAVVTTARPAFTWKTGTGANRYRIEISQDESDFDPPAIPDAIVTTTRYTATISLPQGEYFWRVWSLDAAGNESLAPSDSRSFVVNYSTSPATNAVITAAESTQVNLTWSKVPGLTSANTIVVQIDDDDDFSSPERISPILSYTTVRYNTSLLGSMPNTNPFGHGIYFWRVLVNGHPAWPEELARSFTISPAAPTAPPLDALPTVTNDTTPLFSWDEVTSPTGATVTGYELQLSTSKNFASLVGGSSINIPGGATTSYEWTPALPGAESQAYYARIRAVTSLNVFSRWSTVRTFKLDTVLPDAPELLQPAANAALTNPKPTFTWRAISGVASYEIRYGTQADLSAITPISVTKTSYVAASNLLLTTYYWQVRAIDQAGNVGLWSAADRTFSVASPPGAAPTLWFYTDNTPELRWTPMFWAAVYEIQVSRDNAFTDIVWQSNAIAASGDPVATVGTALADGSYYWRVRGRMPADAGAAWGPFSAIGSFTVDAP